MSCANNVLPVYMWPSPGKIPEALCLPPVQVDTVHFSSEATETNGFSRLSSSLNRTAVTRGCNRASGRARRSPDLHIIATRDMADWLEELPKGTDVTARIKLFSGTEYFVDWS